ncbi:peptide deformylase [Candidatus Microgenomates bacterium]|nr:peptide deformylase [Candidatus Microgenomates bacterium]
MQIVKVPNPILTTPSKPIDKIDKKTMEFIEEAKQVLLATVNPKGVGLAAPQVGRGIRIFLTKPTEKSAISVFINPQIIWQSEEKTEGVPQRDRKFEGCLSIPNVWGMVHRAKEIKVKYQSFDFAQDKHLQPKTYNLKPTTRVFTGFMATIIQHETDHINGILFTQRVLEQKEKLYKITGRDEKGEEVFEPLEV